jgi:hypothetical protein
MSEANDILLDEDGTPITECYCDPCGDLDCSCRGKRCDFCLEQNE